MSDENKSKQSGSGKKANLSLKQRVLIIVGVLVAIVLFNVIQSCNQLPRKVRTHLQKADQQASNSVDIAITDVHDFFEQVKQNSPLFAEKALGWGSKWRVAADFVPMTRGDRHEEYMDKCFKEILFSPEDLSQALENAILKYQNEVESIENEMLVNIRRDVPDLPESSLLHTTTPEKLSEMFNQVIGQSVKDTQTAATGAIGVDVVSLISSEILARVAIKLGISGGIIGIGASGSWATFGVSVIAGIIVDYVIGKIWDWCADPKGDIVKEINQRIDELERLIIDGDGKEITGLRKELRHLDQTRQIVRQEALVKMLRESE